MLLNFMNFDFMKILSGIIVLFTVIPVREYARAKMADRLGDPTPRYNGRLTLNPIKHLDLLGSIAIVLIGFGWGKPMPINESYFSNPKKDSAKVALAGPIANICVSFILMIVVRILSIFMILSRSSNILFLYSVLSVIATLLSMIAQTSIYLAVFYLLPIPPLDGSKILFSILPSKYYYKYLEHQNIINIIFFAVVILGLLSPIIGFLGSGVYYVLSSIVSLIPVPVM